MEVISQNSLHCTAAIERLDTDTAPGLSIQLCGNYNKVTWSQKGWEEPEVQEGGIGVSGGKWTEGSRIDGRKVEL